MVTTLGSVVKSRCLTRGPSLHDSLGSLAKGKKDEQLTKLSVRFTFH